MMRNRTSAGAAVHHSRDAATQVWAAQPSEPSDSDPPADGKAPVAPNQAPEGEIRGTVSTEDWMNLPRAALLPRAIFIVAAASLGACSSSSKQAAPSASGGSTADGAIPADVAALVDVLSPPESANPLDSATPKPSSDSAAARAQDSATARNTSPICSDLPITGDLTSSALPAPPAAGADVSFRTDWSGMPRGGGYNRTQIMNPCRMQPDGTQTAHGMPAVRVEVRPGDDPLALGANSERAEVLIMQDASGPIYESAASGTQYYATSYYFPATWDGTFLRGNSNSWSYVMQFHGTGSGLPGGLSAGRHTASGPQIYQLQGVGQTYDLSNGGIALGQWTDFIFGYTWAATATGHITVFRRDEGQAKFTQVLDVPNVVTMPSASETYYWKQGLYRGGDVAGRADVFWFGPTARAASFAAVEMAAFATSNGT